MARLVWKSYLLLDNMLISYISKNLFNDIVIKYNLKGNSEEQTMLNVEDWLTSYINNIFISLDKYYEEVSNLLGIKVDYYGSKTSNSCLIFK